ncbi:MAG: hypothetical protein IJP88_07090 [Synergistaceae bacterium]|nr:hypothetical protein [Synergistaceae bacterium]MBR0096930.1 hypothetical protein [Synergistaceae bacterium]
MQNRELNDDYNRILEEYGIKPPSEIAQTNIDIARAQMRAQRQNSFLSPAPMQPNEESEEDRVRAVRAQYDWDFERGAPRVFEQPAKQNPAQLQVQQAAEPQSIDDRIKEMYAESMRKKTASSPQKNNQVQAQVPIQDMVMDDTPEPDVRYGMELPNVEVDMQSDDDRYAALLHEEGITYEEDPRLREMREANERHFAQVRGLMDGSTNAQNSSMRVTGTSAYSGNDNENFQKALAFTRQYEGGANFHVANGKAVLKKNARADSGGLTIYGITEATLKSAHKAGIVKHHDITKLTQKEADLIYKKRYWEPSNAGKFVHPVSLCIFDCVVNHGLGGAARILRRAAKNCGQKIEVNTKYDKNLVKALQACDAKKLVNAIYKSRKQSYEDTIAKKPKNEVFRQGWMTRNNGMGKTSGVSPLYPLPQRKTKAKGKKAKTSKAAKKK